MARPCGVFHRQDQAKRRERQGEHHQMRRLGRCAACAQAKGGGFGIVGSMFGRRRCGADMNQIGIGQRTECEHRAEPHPPRAREVAGEWPFEHRDAVEDKGGAEASASQTQPEALGCTLRRCAQQQRQTGSAAERKPEAGGEQAICAMDAAQEAAEGATLGGAFGRGFGEGSWGELRPKRVNCREEETQGEGKGAIPTGRPIRPYQNQSPIPPSAGSGVRSWRILQPITTTPKSRAAKGKALKAIAVASNKRPITT